MGFSNDEVQLPTLGVDLPSDISGLYFGLTFRRNHKFNKIGSKIMFPYGSETLRILDFAVLRGNDIREVRNQATGELVLQALSFGGDRIFLASSQAPGPYIRFRTDGGIPKYADRLLLENLVFDLEKYRVLRRSDIPNCLHQLDASHCLVCQNGHHFVDDHQTCQQCLAPGIRQTAFDFCRDLGLSAVSLDTSNIKKLEHNFSNAKLYNLGPRVSLKSSAFSYYSGADPADLSNFRSSSIVPDLNDQRITFVRVVLKFGIPDKSHFNPPNFNFSLTSQSGVIKYILTKYYSGTMNPVDSDDYAEILFTLYAGAEGGSMTYDFLNFAFKSREEENITVDTSSPQTLIQLASMSRAQFEGHLEPAPFLASGGTLRPISIPVNYMQKQFIFHPRGLFGYAAEDYDGSNELSGGFLVVGKNLNYFRVCASNCEKCSSILSCDSCRTGYFLSGSGCASCSGDCQTCASHSRKCLLCADGQVPKSTHILSRAKSAP